MALDLCEQGEYTERNRQRELWYLDRKENLITGIQALRECGRIAGNTAFIMERRVHSAKKDWQTNYFDSTDLLAYHLDERIKLVHDGLLCADLLSQLDLCNGLWIGDEELYEALPGTEFRRRDLKLDEGLYAQEAKEHGLWKALARDEQLLGEYAEKFYLQKKIFMPLKKMMSIYLPSRNGIILGAFGVGWLDDGGGSGADGESVLDYDDSCLVGSTPEASAVLTAKYPYLASREQEVRGVLERYFAGREEEIQKSGTQAMKLSKKAGMPIIVPTPRTILDEKGIEISDVYVKMPTPAEQWRENLQQMIESTAMDEETYQKIRKELENKK